MSFQKTAGIISKFCYLVLCLIILAEGFYWSLISLYFKMQIRYTIYLVLAVVILLSAIVLRFRKRDRYIILCLLVLLAVMLVRNKELAHGISLDTLRSVSCIVMIIFSFMYFEWYDRFPQYIVLIGLPNIVATILFFMNNKIYQSFIRATYHTYQSGTNHGINGYKAALADNYSQNGTYITIVLITLGAIILVGTLGKNNKIKINKWLIALMAVCVFALLLTTKRAHIMFSAATLIVTYFVVNYQKNAGKYFRFLMIAAVIVALFALLMEYIPELGAFMERFQKIGEGDVGMTARMDLWKKALSEFKENPIFGIGWYGFRYVVGLTGNALTASKSGAHNSYLELLCDSGIVGFLLFMTVAVWSIVNTVKNLRSSTDLVERRCLAVSFAIQFFVLLYAFSGNAFFDKTLNFYSIAIAIGISCSVRRTANRESALHKSILSEP